VTNVSVTNVTNVYNKTVIVNNTTVNNVSYNGGEGGIRRRPMPQEQAAEREHHVEPVAMQMQHEQLAAHNRQNFANENHGRPVIAATARPGDFSARSAVAARAAGGEYHPPAMSPREARGPAAPGNRPFTPANANNSNRPMGNPAVTPQDKGNARGNANNGFRPFTPPNSNNQANKTTTTNPTYHGNTNSGTNPMYENRGNAPRTPVYHGSGGSGTNPMHEDKGNIRIPPGNGNSGTNPMYENKGNARTSPVYHGNGNSGTNPMYEPKRNSAPPPPPPHNNGGNGGANNTYRPAPERRSSPPPHPQNPPKQENKGEHNKGR